MKQRVDSTIMLQKSLLFLPIADREKNYNEAFISVKTSVFTSISPVYTICMLLCILGLIGNSIMLWFFCCAIKKTKFTIYAANMTVGDFLAALGSFLGFLEFVIPHLVNAHTRPLLLILFVFGYGSKSYFLAAMCTERCLTVFFPVWYQSHRQKCPTAFICAFLWTLSVTLTILNYFLCTRKYMEALSIDTSLCKFTTVSHSSTIFVILIPSIVFSTLALLIRMKLKPQQDFPARLDITIWVLHIMLHPLPELFGLILPYIESRHYLVLFNLALIFNCLNYSVNPFVYLFVGCWKWKKGQEPFYVFLERALKDEREGGMRTQPDQEEA